MGALASYQLKNLIGMYDAPVLFETGSGAGDGIQHAITHNFKKIYSVEIIETQACLLAERFKFDKRVTMVHGRSYNALEKLLPTIDENIIFWLDAHFPGADLVKNDQQRLQSYMAESNDDVRLPLEEELKLIKELRKDNNDVILMDELHIYKDSGDNIGDDAYWLKPRQRFSSSEFYAEIFKDTHKFEYVGDTQGMLLPK